MLDNSFESFVLLCLLLIHFSKHGRFYYVRNKDSEDVTLKLEILWKILVNIVQNVFSAAKE